MASAVDMVTKEFKAEKINSIFEVVNKDGVTRMGMPGDYRITFADASQEVRNGKILETSFQVKA